MTNWTPDDVPWHAFDRSRLDPDLIKLVKAASMVEYNAKDYATYLCNVFREDPGFRDLAWNWAASEIQHGQTLSKWAKLADPDFDFETRFKRFQDGFHVPIDASNSIRGSLTGELLARCVVETGTSSYYAAIRDATSEPVLRDLCSRIAADELRHYKTFYDLSKRYLERERIGLGGRLRVVVGRLIETEDAELAYAYHAANNKEGPFNRKQSNRSYVRRAYVLYQPHLVERVGAMLLKIVGLRPRGWLNRLIGAQGYRFMQRRAKRIAEQDDCP